MDVLAIDAHHVRKTYQLFSSPMRLAAHVFGVDRLWRPLVGQAQTFVALDDVSFSVRRGERVAILGRNGAGKSTLLKAIAGLCLLTGGSIRVNGSVQVLAAGAQTMMTEMTGRQNIESALTYGGLAGKRLAMALADVIDFVELGDFLDQPFGSYSLGMQARTQFAVATAIHPDILLVDELLGAGDGYFSAKSAARMEALMRSGSTIVMVSHSPQAVLEYCDRAIWLRGGRVVRDGAVADVLAAYESDMQSTAAAQGGAHSADQGMTGTVPFHLPAELCTPFVAEQVANAEPVERGYRAQPVAGNMNAGFQVLSYPGPGALRIASVEWSSVPGGLAGFRVGAELRAKIAIRALSDHVGWIRCHLLAYSLAGRRCADVTSEPIQLSLTVGQTHTLECRAPRLMLGTAHYVLSVLIEDAAVEFAPHSRHDLWSLCGAMSYEPCNDSDPPYVHLDALWVFGERGVGQPARMSSVQ